jgi:streptogramin lyase
MRFPSRSQVYIAFSFIVVFSMSLALILSAKSASRATAAPPITITEFPVPTSNNSLDGITKGPDGNLWFTEATENKISQITPTGTVTAFPVPTANAGPVYITTGPDNNLWFTEENGNNIGKMTTNGTITEFPLPTSNSCPDHITSGPDGNLWFTEDCAHNIGKITPSGTITEYPTGDVNLFGITAGPDGNVWFTEDNAISFGGRVVRITPSGVMTDFTLPNPVCSGPTFSGPCQANDITSGPDGNLWFTEGSAHRVGRVTTSGTFTEFLLSGVNSDPTDITSGPDGNLWFTEINGNNIGRITTSGTITEFPVPTSNAGPFGITAGPDGNVWFTETVAKNIGRVNLSKHSQPQPISYDPGSYAGKSGNVSVGSYNEPNDYQHRNYCGPGASQVLISAWTSNVPDIQTLATEEQTNPNSGTLMKNMVSPINNAIGQSYYSIYHASSQADFSNMIGRDILDNHHPLITGIVTIYHNNQLNGWTISANHIITIYGFDFSSPTAGYIYYYDTSGTVAGTTATGPNRIDYNVFWSLVQQLNIQLA